MSHKMLYGGLLVILILVGAGGYLFYNNLPPFSWILTGEEVVDPNIKVVIEELSEGNSVIYDGSPEFGVRIIYTSFLLDGTIIEERMDTPLTITNFDDPTLLKAWKQGLVGMTVGSLRQMTVPSELAYGKKGLEGKVPPNSDILITVQLLSLIQLHTDEPELTEPTIM